MIHVQDYRKTAEDNEAVFRNILIDLRDNREKYGWGIFVPKDLKIDLPLEEFFEMYSAGERRGS